GPRGAGGDAAQARGGEPPQRVHPRDRRRRNPPRRFQPPRPRRRLGEAPEGLGRAGLALSARGAPPQSFVRSPRDAFPAGIVDGARARVKAHGPAALRNARIDDAPSDAGRALGRSSGAGDVSPTSGPSVSPPSASWRSPLGEKNRNQAGAT